MPVYSMIELFPSIIAFAIFYILWLIWFVFEMIFSWTTPFIRNRGKITFEDSGSTALIIMGSFFCIALALYLSLNGIFLIPPWITYVGLGLFAFGMVFRFWAILTIGKQFSPIVGIYKEHALIKNGPYKYVRHPSYSGALLMLLGYGLILRSLIGSIVIVAVMLGIYLYRIMIEERTLSKRFPEGYASYSRDKKKIIPFIL